MNAGTAKLRLVAPSATITVASTSAKLTASAPSATITVTRIA